MNEATYDKLRGAVVTSRKQLAVYRDNIRAAIKEYVGAHYSEDGADDSVPVNLLELTVNIYKRHLVGGQPKILATTYRSDLKPIAKKLQAQVNKRLKQIRFRDTFERFVKAALFGPAIMKVGMDIYAEALFGDEYLPIGESYVQDVSFHDWVHDMSAKSYEQIGFAGHRYRLPMKYVRESGLYKHTGELASTLATEMSSGDDERAEFISRGQPPEQADFIEYVELWDIWIPGDNVVITMPSKTGPMIREQEWEGPGHGPYHLLNFTDVPDQIIGLPPVATWMDMHELANGLFRKLARQASRQKTYTAYRSTATRDAQRAQTVPDGGMIAMDDPEGVVERATGGADANNMAFVLQAIDKYSWFAGNLDAMGGLGPQSETLGQDAILTENASQRLQEMQQRTKEVAAAVCEDLAWYEYTDPVKEDDIELPVEGTGIVLSDTFSPEERTEPFDLFCIDIEPYSLKYRTPPQRLEVITRLVDRIVPLLPLLEQQGVMFDIEAYLRIFGEYTNMPELADIIKFSEPPEQAEGQGAGPRHDATQAPNTTRTNVRINRPGGTRQGKDSVMAQALLGQASQPAEQAAVFRPS